MFTAFALSRSRRRIFDTRWIMTRRRSTVQDDLPQPALIDRIAQNARGLLGSMKAH